MSNLYRGPSIDASYQDSVHLAKWFQRRFLKIGQSETKNCLWWPCLLMDRDEMSNLYRGPSIGVSEEKIKMWKVNRRRTPSDGKSSHCLWQGELKNVIGHVQQYNTFGLMVFNATFNNISAISWRSVLLVEETRRPGENHRSATSQWQTLSHNVVLLALSGSRTHNSQWWKAQIA